MWRLLEVGEVIENGDELWMNDGEWLECIAAIGDTVCRVDVVRRKVADPVCPLGLAMEKADSACKITLPDPGDGWRLIDKAVDKPEKGDEIWNEDHWEVRGHWFDCKAYNKNNVYRRKLPAQPAPVVSVGDRVEVVSGTWAKSCGVVVADWYISAPEDVTIRLDNVFVGGKPLTVRILASEVSALKSAPKASVQVDPEWRLLEIGEVIREGDQFGDNGRWRKTDSVGQKYLIRFGDYRRRVRIESPGWRYLDAGETVKAGDETGFSAGVQWRDAAKYFELPYVVRNHDKPSVNFRRKTTPFAG